mgnify:FL=1
MKNLKHRITESILSSLTSLDFPKKDFLLTPSNNPEFGDLSSNIALLLTNELKIKPLEIAQTLANELSKNPLDEIKSISVTAPGFINFFIFESFYQSKIESILKEKESFGKTTANKGKTANVEFVSANPTGPLTVGHGRNAVIGDTISSILDWHGFEVTRE